MTQCIWYTIEAEQLLLTALIGLYRGRQINTRGCFELYRRIPNNDNMVFQSFTIYCHNVLILSCNQSDWLTWRLPAGDKYTDHVVGTGVGKHRDSVSAVLVTLQGDEEASLDAWSSPNLSDVGRVDNKESHILINRLVFT